MEGESTYALIIAADLAAPAFIFNGAQLGSLSPGYDVKRSGGFGLEFWSKLVDCFPADF